MLIRYQQDVRRLLNDQRFEALNDFDSLVYINQARRQIALDSEVLRQPADLVLSVGVQSYAFSAATYVAAPTIIAGLGSIVLIRSAALSILSGYQRLEIRPWEYFESYWIDQVTATQAQPTRMAQQLLGAGVGTLWFSPTPDTTYTVRLFPVCIPLDLVDDSTPEALPVPWQDAVPYYAAYIAYLTMKDKEAAGNMWERYQTFEMRATRQVTGTQLPGNFPVFREPASTNGSESRSGNR